MLPVDIICKQLKRRPRYQPKCDFFGMQYKESRAGGKDQESIQSSTIPDPEHRVGKETKTQESQEVSPFQAGDHKASRNSHDSIIKIKMKHK